MPTLGLDIVFYADDLTGATDVMEVLDGIGIPTALFLEPPDPVAVASLVGLKAVGVAGSSRTMSPAQMRTELPPILRGLSALGAPLFHYKVCSTFDSSVERGSIGIAAEIVLEVFSGRSVPIVVGVPQLGRFTAFGTLFASFQDDIHRLDRHPAMRSHPSTPMTESDLRVILHEQTSLRVDHVDTHDLDADEGSAVERILTVASEAPDLVLLDVADMPDQLRVGRALSLLVEQARASGVVQAVIGSSGVEYALGRARPAATDAWSQPSPPTPTLVVVGSRSPVSIAQTEHALQAGFLSAQADATQLIATRTHRDETANAAVAALAQGHHTVIHVGPTASTVDGTELARALGRTARTVLDRVKVKRLVVAGGDTAGFVARALGIQAIRATLPLTAGAPLCRVVAGHPRVADLELCFKGGAIGDPDYFVQIAKLGAAASVPTTERAQE